MNSSKTISITNYKETFLLCNNKIALISTLSIMIEYNRIIDLMVNQYTYIIRNQ
jgi:hypothetical protein